MNKKKYKTLYLKTNNIILMINKNKIRYKTTINIIINNNNYKQDIKISTFRYKNLKYL